MKVSDFMKSGIQKKTAPVMTPLRLGEIRPEGWILNQMKRDLASGMAGCFNRLRPEFDTYIYAQQRGAANHGEMTGNWMDGFIRMAFLTGDTERMKQADRMAEEILDSADEDGYLGSFPPDKRYQSSMTGELLMQSRLYIALLAYYEFTGREEVLDAVKKAVHVTMEHYPEGKSCFTPKGDVPKQTVKDHNKLKDADLEERRAGWVDHGLIFLDVLEFLFRLTGERAYADFGVRLYEDFSESDMIVMRDLKLDDVLDDQRPLFWHGPHAAEHLRAPVWLSTVSDDPRFSAAADAGYRKLRNHLTPSGSLVSNEHVRNQPGNCDREYEYCTTTMLAESLQQRLRVTGDAMYGDMIENLVFNAGQASRTPDGKNITYLTRDTRFSATQQREGGRRKLSPAHEIGNSCCSANAVKLMPYYTSSMWARKENGLAAVLFGPSSVSAEIRGNRITIEEKTQYPFSEELEFVMHPDSPVRFSFSFRIPDWCSTNVEVDFPDAEIHEEDGFKVLTRTWDEGDRVRVGFKASVTLQRTPDGEGVIRRGPLMYALPLEARMEKLERRLPVEGFYDYDVFCANEFVKSALFVDAAREDCGFSLVKNPDGDPGDPWTDSPLQLNGSLPHAMMFHSKKDTSCTLLPLGCSILRAASFPIWPFQKGNI